MNCRARNRKVAMTEDLQEEIARIDAIWNELRGIYGAHGPWLFGEFTIADCMFAPVVFRFLTYNADISAGSQKYMAHLLAHPKVQLWQDQAQKEVETIESEEVG